jgi:cytidylate kinase
MTNDALSPEERLFVAQSSVIRQIAASGESCVILGRCADYVLYNDPNCFRIFVHARTEIRVRRIMALFNLDEAEARRQLENTDRARAQHYRRFTGREYGKQESYHLGVDSGMLGTEESVAVIMDVLRRWCDVRGTHPLSALK